MVDFTVNIKEQQAMLSKPLLDSKPGTIKNVTSVHTVAVSNSSSSLKSEESTDSLPEEDRNGLSLADGSSTTVDRIHSESIAAPGSYAVLTSDAVSEGPKWLTIPLLMTVLSCTIGGSFQFGFAVGFVNNTALYVKQYMVDMGYEYEAVQAAGLISPTTSQVVLDARINTHFTFWWSIAVSIFGCGAFFGSFFGPMASNHPKIGRRNAILLNNIFFLSSCCLLGFVPSLFPWTSLILGRFLVGVGSGAATGCVPLYVAEIAPKQIRGFLGTIHQLLITIGIFVSQALTTGDFHLLGSEDLWQYVMLVPAGCCIYQIFTLVFVPESPSYLYKIHFGQTGEEGRERCRQSLKFFRRGIMKDETECDALIEEELDEILMELTGEGGTVGEGVIVAEQECHVPTEEKLHTFNEEKSISRTPSQAGLPKRDSSDYLLDPPRRESSISKSSPSLAISSPMLAFNTANLVDRKPHLELGIKDDQPKEPTLYELCFASKRSVQMPIIIGIIVNLTMQLSGMDAVLYYSTQVFLNAGIPLETAEVCTTLVGFVNFLVTIPAMIFMDVSGRKTIQLTGLGGMFIGYNLMVFSQCMAVWAQREDAVIHNIPFADLDYQVAAGGFGAFFDYWFTPVMSGIDHSLLRPLYVLAGIAPVLFYRYLAVFSMMWIVICFAFGPGCIAWFIIAELCPIEARAAATSLGLGFNALANWAVAFFFPICLGILGRFTFVIFVFFTALFFSLTNWLLIETKGKSPSEVESHFRKKYD